MFLYKISLTYDTGNHLFEKKLKYYNVQVILHCKNEEIVIYFELKILNIHQRILIK